MCDHLESAQNKLLYGNSTPWLSAVLYGPQLVVWLSICPNTTPLTHVQASLIDLLRLLGGTLSVQIGFPDCQLFSTIFYVSWKLHLDNLYTLMDQITNGKEYVID